MAPATVARGREAFKQFVVRLRTAFPNIRFTVDGQDVAKDGATVRFTMSGTHRRAHRCDYQGIQPTDRSFTVSGIDSFAISDGRIRKVKAEFDLQEII